MNTMSDEIFWKAIADMGWAENGFNYEQIGESLKQRIDAAYEPQQAAEVKASLLETYNRKSNALYYRLDKVVNNLGDDGYSDLLAHIIGLGQAEYEAVMADPSLGRERAKRYDFEESFSYCFHQIDPVISAVFASPNAD